MFETFASRSVVTTVILLPSVLCTSAAGSDEWWPSFRGDFARGFAGGHQPGGGETHCCRPDNPGPGPAHGSAMFSEFA
jgi:hypothetical protein